MSSDNVDVMTCAFMSWNEMKNEMSHTPTMVASLDIFAVHTFCHQTHTLGRTQILFGRSDKVTTQRKIETRKTVVEWEWEF